MYRTSYNDMSKKVREIISLYLFFRANPPREKIWWFRAIWGTFLVWLLIVIWVRESPNNPATWWLTQISTKDLKQWRVQGSTAATSPPLMIHLMQLLDDTALKHSHKRIRLIIQIINQMKPLSELHTFIRSDSLVRFTETEPPASHFQLKLILKLKKKFWIRLIWMGPDNHWSTIVQGTSWTQSCGMRPAGLLKKMYIRISRGLSIESNFVNLSRSIIAL